MSVQIDDHIIQNFTVLMSFVQFAACVYGKWSDWSKCDDWGHQVRKQELLYNPFRLFCTEIEEIRDCESESIDSK